MQLCDIKDKEGIDFKKVLIPSNSGYKGMTPDPLHELGIPDQPGDNFKLDDLGMEVVRLRAEDIPKACDDYTKSGTPVLGLTGDDVYDEYLFRTAGSGLRVVDTVDWMVDDVDGQRPRYSRPTLCLIGLADATYGKFPAHSVVAIDAKFEQTSQRFLNRIGKEYGVQFEAKVQSGKIENNIPDRAQYGIDIVLSGDTLKYTDKASKTPRDPALAILKAIRQSDMSVITSWPRPGTTDVLRTQYGVIVSRRDQPTGSDTSKLLADPNKIRKKLGEEMAELVAAHAQEKNPLVLEEMQQVLWTLQVMAAERGLTWDEVLAEVEKAQ